LLPPHKLTRVSSYKPLGFADGVITKIDAGWHQTSPGIYKRPVRGRPNDKIIVAFRKYVDVFANLENNGIWDNGFLDHDKENLRRRVSDLHLFEYARDPRTQLSNLTGRKIREFGVSMFDACVHYCALDGICVT
jgi:hypothetical protein